MPQISFFHKCHSWVHAPHPPFHFSIPWIDIGFLAEEPPAPLQKAPSRPSVTNILVNPANQSGQDLVISPWAPSSSTGQTPIKKSPDNVVSVECKSPTIDPNLSGQPHPFIYRVQNQVDFSPPSRLPATSLSPPMFHLTLTYDHLTLTYDHLTLNYDHLTLTYDHLTLTYDHLTLTYDPLTLTYDHLTLT